MKSQSGSILPQKYLRANYHAIEQDLYNYNTIVDYINRMLTEYDDTDFEPSIKASAPNGIYMVRIKSKAAGRKKENREEPYKGHPIRPVSDPTFNAAMLAAGIDNRHKRAGQIINAMGFNEMIRRAKAIEETLDRFDLSEIPDEKTKSQLVKERYFDRLLTPVGLAEKYKISERTVYYWCTDVISEIALKLGFII